ncbi:hypothetical protein [Microbacterium sp. SLBN-146]
MEQLDDLLVAVDVELSDELMDRIDAIVPPGTGVGRGPRSTTLPPSSTRD